METTRKVALAVAFSLALAGCGGGTSEDGLDLAVLDTPDVPADPGKDIGPDAPKEPVVVDEDFRFVYGYSGRIPGDNLGEYDLLVGDPRDDDWPNDWANDVSLTKESLSKISLNCDMGCFLDRGMRWLAVAVDEGEGGTHTVQLARFTNKLALTSLGKIGKLENVKYLVFAGDYMYFSQPQECGAQGSVPVPCYRISRLNLNTPGVVDNLLTMPTPELIEKSQGYQYFGYFTVGEDLNTLLFLLPTNVSQSVWVWKEGKLRKVVEDLCAAKDPLGNCIGSGTSSLYHDNDPAAISPDGKHVVFALVEDNAELRLYRHDLETDQTRYSVLLGVPSDYFTNACYNRASWQYTKVASSMRFTPDGKEVVFVGSHECGDNKQKPWTNIVRIALEKIGSGAKLTESDLKKVTDNPEGKVAKAISISAFDFSPTGEYIVLAGTPTIEEDGSALITDSSARHYKDAEIYVTRTDGTTLPVQLTNELEWKAVSVTAIETP